MDDQVCLLMLVTGSKYQDDTGEQVWFSHTVNVKTYNQFFLSTTSYLSKSQGFKPVCFLNAAEK